jgi:hypothetical protein
MVACIIFKFDPVYISDHQFNKLICRVAMDQLKNVILMRKNKLIESKKVLENTVAV